MDGLRRVATFVGSYDFNGQTITVQQITLSHLAEIEARIWFACPLHVEHIILNNKIDITISDLKIIENQFRTNARFRNVSGEMLSEFLCSPDGMMFTAWQMLRHHERFAILECCIDWLNGLIDQGWSIEKFMLYRDIISGFDITTRSEAEDPWSGIRPQNIEKRKKLLGNVPVAWDKFFYQVSAGNYICLQDSSNWTIAQYQLLCSDPKAMGMDFDKSGGSSELPASNKRRL